MNFDSRRFFRAVASIVVLPRFLPNPHPELTPEDPEPVPRMGIGS